MILVNEPLSFPKKSIDKLKKYGKIYTSKEKFKNKNIKIIFIRLSQNINSTFLDNFPNLSIIVSPTTGLTHLDLLEIKKRKICLISLKGRTSFLKNIFATAEFSIGLTLTLLRKIHLAIKSTEKAKWNRYPFKGSEINGKLVLIIGFGRIGKQVFKLYKSFGAKIIAYDINSKIVPKKIKTSLKKGIKYADIISIHIPCSFKNINFFNKELCSLIKKTAILINTSRGEIIDQKTLINLILKKKIAGAALDVLQNEPNPINTQLKKDIYKIKDRLIITPHIAGFTNESLNKVETYLTEILIKKLKMIKSKTL
jgi:D-3-phosphoglycerate dehydrogenase / 2-oxoglutarate reductase